jgi:hypothetical protein
MQPNAGSVVAVGTDAIIGDVVVAGVVLSDKVDESFSFEFEHTPTTNESDVWISHRILGRLFMLKSSIDRNTGMMNAIPTKSLISSGYSGAQFKQLVAGIDFFCAIGFRPESICDLVDRTDESIQRMSSIVKSKAAGEDIPMSLAGGFFAPHRANSHSDYDRISDNLPHMWKNRPLSSSVSISAPDEISDSQRLQLCLGGMLAGAIADSVRAVRVLDLDSIYPALRLGDNWGYSSSSLYQGIVKSQIVSGNHCKGDRGEITAHWLKYYEASTSIDGIPTIDPAFATQLAATGDDLEDLSDWHPHIANSPKGSVIAFSRSRALSMLGVLGEFTDHLDTFGKEFTKSIAQQLSNGRLLSGRQMYTLYGLYKKHAG